MASGEKTELSTSRLLALADGIFAIALTLLVFEIKVPEGAAPGHLAERLSAQWPKFASCALSFVTLSYSWIGHHNQYVAIRKTNRPFLWINMAFLFCIALVPFTSALLGEYPSERFAVLCYAGILAVSGALLYWHWRYATTEARLIDPATPALFVKRTSQRVLAAPLAYLLVMALAFASTRASLIVCLLIPVGFMIPGGVDRHWAQR